MKSKFDKFAQWIIFIAMVTYSFMIVNYLSYFIRGVPGVQMVPYVLWIIPTILYLWLRRTRHSDFETHYLIGILVLILSDVGLMTEHWRYIGNDLDLYLRTFEHTLMRCGFLGYILILDLLMFNRKVAQIPSR